VTNLVQSLEIAHVLKLVSKRNGKNTLLCGTFSQPCVTLKNDPVRWGCKELDWAGGLEYSRGRLICGSKYSYMFTVHVHAHCTAIVISARHWILLPADGFTDPKYYGVTIAKFKILLFLIVCISWRLKCWCYLMYSVNMKIINDKS
jgi:hypothetical protein